MRMNGSGCKNAPLGAFLLWSGILQHLSTLNSDIEFANAERADIEFTNAERADVEPANAERAFRRVPTRHRIILWHSASKSLISKWY